MATKHIPARTVVTCDACQRSDMPRKMESVLTYTGAALDMVGDPVANAKWERDYCDSCWRRIERAIQSAEGHLMVESTANPKETP